MLAWTNSKYFYFFAIFAILTRLYSRPDIWPTRIQIAGRSPLSRAQILQRQAIENKLPFCQFRPLNTSSQQDQNNFTLLVRNLDQKKYVSSIYSECVCVLIRY